MFATAPYLPNPIVSIRTRQPCRVNECTGGSKVRPTSFNPHPAALPGEWPTCVVAFYAYRVSIRTRQPCRVNVSSPNPCGINLLLSYLREVGL